MARAICSAAAQEVIAPDMTDGLNWPERLAIHARHFRTTLTAALADAFPSVKRLTGDGFFAYACAQFIASAPPTDPIVNHFGEGFPAFLANFGPASGFPWLADVARLEWLRHSMSDTLDTQEGSAALYTSPWRVDLLCEVNGPEETDISGETCLALIIQGERIVQRTLTRREFDALSASLAPTTST